MKIQGYTCIGDYYLADKIIPGKTWKEACEMKEEITLPNGKKVIARTLSKKELETIPKQLRQVFTSYSTYWTSTKICTNYAWSVYYNGAFDDCLSANNIFDKNGVPIYDNVRLGFRNPFLD